MAKSVLSQIQSRGEDAIERIANSPATRSAIQSAMQLKDRAGKTLSGLEGIEERLTAIEKRLSALEKPAKKPAATRTRSTSSKTGSKPAASTTASTSKPRSSTGKTKTSS
jgi:hypothetical protein